MMMVCGCRGHLIEEHHLSEFVKGESMYMPSDYHCNLSYTKSTDILNKWISYSFNYNLCLIYSSFSWDQGVGCFTGLLLHFIIMHCYLIPECMHRKKHLLLYCCKCCLYTWDLYNWFKHFSCMYVCPHVHAYIFVKFWKSCRDHFYFQERGGIEEYYRAPLKKQFLACLATSFFLTSLDSHVMLTEYWYFPLLWSFSPLQCPWTFSIDDWSGCNEWIVIVSSYVLVEQEQWADFKQCSLTVQILDIAVHEFCGSLQVCSWVGY
jgi:hypothetical protein